ncbi:uncharacterized protein [Physcomitrium patens]|uniref:uncharacterized protein n=1 Tax=Physcomitrium patens TaxID=3218 RepID=UPI003CCDF83C
MEVWKKFLPSFHEQSTPVIEYYTQKGIVRNIEAAKSATTFVSQEIQKARSLNAVQLIYYFACSSQLK